MIGWLVQHQQTGFLHKQACQMRAHDPATAQLLTGTLEIPDVKLESDIGGYEKVKKRLRQEIIDVLAVLNALRAAFPPKVISDMAEPT